MCKAMERLKSEQEQEIRILKARLSTVIHLLKVKEKKTEELTTQNQNLKNKISGLKEKLIILAALVAAFGSVLFGGLRALTLKQQ